MGNDHDNGQEHLANLEMRKLQSVAKRFNLNGNNVDETLMAKGLDERVWLYAAVECPKDQTALIPNGTKKVQPLS